jgi:hypothetical protein
VALAGEFLESKQDAGQAISRSTILRSVSGSLSAAVRDAVLQVTGVLRRNRPHRLCSHLLKINGTSRWVLLHLDQSQPCPIANRRHWDANLL